MSWIAQNGIATNWVGWKVLYVEEQVNDNDLKNDWYIILLNHKLYREKVRIRIKKYLNKIVKYIWRL